LNTHPNPRIDRLNSDFKREYDEDISRAAGIQFPAEELDDLVNQFNGLLALNIE
jgi:hypothetical protein